MCAVEGLNMGKQCIVMTVIVTFTRYSFRDMGQAAKITGGSNIRVIVLVKV